MPKPGNTTARGYGYAHRRKVAQLHQQHRDGDLCRRCGHPMYRSQSLDGGHPPGAHPELGDLPDALEHASCNRAAGQRTAHNNRYHPTPQFRQSRTWLP